MPADAEVQPRKRPRPIISCLRCREKKLKCDRVAPCENCRKAGCSSDCAFQHAPEGPKRPRLGDGPDQSLDLEDGKVGIIEGLQHRLKRLEDILAMNPHNPFLASFAFDKLGIWDAGQAVPPLNGLEPFLRMSSPDAPFLRAPTSDAPTDGPPAPNVPSSTPPYPGVLVVKGTRTLYHGQTNRVSLLHQYTDAKTFINHECNMSSPIFRLAKEIQFLQSRSKAPKSSESVLEAETSEFQQLRDRLPPFDVCERLIILYTTNFEKTFRILHVPTFELQFAQFKAGSIDGDQYSGFLAQLTAVLVASLPLVESQFLLDYPTVHNYLQNDAINLVCSWLRKLGRKQRTETSTLQTEAVVILARQMRRDSPGDLWQATGELVRSAMLIGLHLDVSKATQISALQKEVRRRLWTTIAEMDIQASIVSGMPVTIPDLNFDPLSPTNLNDSDFDDSMDQLPTSRPTHEWTDALPQVLLAASLRTRIQAMAFVQSGSCNLAQGVTLARELEKHLQHVGNFDPPTRPGKATALVFNSVLVDLYIRRPLICLYSHMSKCQPSNSLRNASLDSCLIILSHQDYFDPTVADLGVPAFWEIFQIFCTNDILRAALFVCEHIKQPMATLPKYHTKASLIRGVDNTLQALIRSFGHPGSSFKDILLLSVELHLVRVGGMEGEKKELVHRGVLETLLACRERLIVSSAQQQNDLAQVLQTLQPLQPNVMDTPISLSQFPDLGDPTFFGAEFDNFMPFQDDAIDAYFADI
ncbi:hypothetical protein BJX63DRAFT_39821 [Aspergillus granulosus]|uniref:Zn(2)-C6 fungal-type domain-containing protein n=1 Tax=Aspergillus granulosus TaxID=176169 RepID=A0ABR4GYL6_9EURO